MSEARTSLQRMRSVIVKLFPWLPGFVSVAGAKGKGLAIRAAGGLIHLAGGPDDPAVHRVGDAGTGGTVTIQGFQTTPPSTVVITYLAPDLTPTVITIAGLVVAADFGPFSFTIATKATTGSEKVTCA